MGDEGSALYLHVLLLFGNIGWKVGRGEKDVLGLEVSIFNEININPYASVKDKSKTKE